ncbi:hypothetical protein LOTGIDRAFT_158334 [Lottia gigantea]|uniref:TIR domain-containing protein n=1 Tax=Lottia gigantea TaxID=225164 RepID=V4A804_LOTGI|nr:hypothetical protein LOTGIDRAFT_158334 [Lottia gigantea]ESP00104.1 hypothetical protein LOTGIDRAFT_158334 [Lottia gigantea]
MELDEEYNAFLQDLQQYPNYFQMGTENCSSNLWRKISKKLEDEKEDLPNFSDMVQIRNQNLEACVSYNLGDVDKAENIISKVLEDTHSSSINACAMMAILSYKKGEITKAKRNLSRIKELAADPYNIDVAKSELAYAYTRLNPKYYTKAIAAYAEAVERNPNNFPWKFGLAQIYRRCMNTPIQAMFPDLQIETCFNEAKKHLEYVLENCTDKKDRFFKARSYIELADLYGTANTTSIAKTHIHKITHLVHQGVQCLPENTNVLMKGGKLLRHCFQFKEAEALLQKAYDICPNSYICHQLGLIRRNNIIHHHGKPQQYSKRNQRYGPSQASGSWRGSSFPSTMPAVNKKLDCLASSKNKSTDGSTNTGRRRDLAETLSKMSLSVSKNSEDSSSSETNQRNDPIVKMTRLINSPGKETYDFELSRKLGPCIDLFSQSAELGQEQNMAVYYDWGITLLQMTPTNYDEVMEKFNHILEHDPSPFYRYRCYEQYGICKIRMSESQDFDQTSREEYRQDAVEMFRRAIRCWAYCQKINLGKHFDDAEGNCTSLKSIREIILGEDSEHRTKPKKDMASLYYLVRQYGSSLSLYQEVHDKLKRASDTDTDSEVIQGIINNHIQLQQFTGVLDLLALLLCSKEALQCLEFKTEVLTQMMHHSIDTNDYKLAESVFNFEKDPNEECDSDVAIIFNKDDQVTKKTAASLPNWLGAFSKSGLKVIKSSETAANLPGIQEQIKLISNSKMVIFILANENPSELTYLMNTALKARCSDDHILKKIFPIIINDGMVPDIFQNFKTMKMTHNLNTVDEQNKSSFLKTFSEIFLE